jgi:hypothetical protein
VVAVSEILGMASSAVSNSYNPSPLTLGALAYLILFFPMVVFGRWLETPHGLEALTMLQTFFNLDIIKAAWPILLAGPGQHGAALAGGGAARPRRRLDPRMLASVRNPWVRCR